MANPLEKEVVVQEGGTPSPIQIDKHHNPDYPPEITAITAPLLIRFDQDTPNQNYRPIDAIIKLRIECPAGPNIAAGTTLCVLKFGSEYQTAEAKPLPPVVIEHDETVAFPSTIRAVFLTSTTFAIRNDEILLNGIYRVRFAVTPSI